MGISRDTQLVENASDASVLLGGIDGLASLEREGSAVTVAALLLEAHRWVYDQLRKRYTAAELLTLSNPEPLHRIEAARFAVLLVVHRLILRTSENANDLLTFWAGQANEVLNFRAEFEAAASARRAGEALPGLANQTSRPMFGGDDAFEFHTKLPRRRTS